MEFKDFVYLSDRKVNQMYSQLTAHAQEIEFKGEATLGVIKAGISRKEREAADSIQRLTRILQYLRENGQVGSIAGCSKYFEGSIYAHCLLIGGSNAFFFGKYSNSTPHSGQNTGNSAEHILLGLACSMDHMIGGGYEPTELPGELAQPRGKAKAYGIKYTSSNVGFASGLMSADRVSDRKEELESLRNSWTAKYQVLDSDVQALAKHKYANRFVEFLHRIPTPSQDCFFPAQQKSWPLEEPKPRLELKRPSRILRWILGQRLYERKVIALNKKFQLNSAIARTSIEPLAIEALREIRHLAKDTKPPVRGYSDYMVQQLYNFVALRIADATIQEERVILASPLYLALGK